MDDAVWSTRWRRCGYDCLIWQVDDGGWFWEMRVCATASIIGYAPSKLDAIRLVNGEAVRYSKI